MQNMIIIKKRLDLASVRVVLVKTIHFNKFINFTLTLTDKLFSAYLLMVREEKRREEKRREEKRREEKRLLGVQYLVK